MKYILIFIIKLYRLTFSKILPPSCRFTPSCSQYGLAAVQRFGAVKGGYLALRRICRCNPFGGGYDPLPDEFRFSYRKMREDMERSGKLNAVHTGGKI